MQDWGTESLSNLPAVTQSLKIVKSQAQADSLAPEPVQALPRGTLPQHIQALK